MNKTLRKAIAANMDRLEAMLLNRTRDRSASIRFVRTAPDGSLTAINEHRDTAIWLDIVSIPSGRFLPEIKDETYWDTWASYEAMRAQGFDIEPPCLLLHDAPELFKAPAIERLTVAPAEPKRTRADTEEDRERERRRRRYSMS